MITLRDAIVHSGRDMRRPMDLLNRMKTINADQDVNRALMTMLSLEEEGDEEVRVRVRWWPGASALIRT